MTMQHSKLVYMQVMLLHLGLRVSQQAASSVHLSSTRVVDSGSHAQRLDSCPADLYT